MKGILRYNGDNYGKIGEATNFVPIGYFHNLRVGDLITYKFSEIGCTHKGIVIKKGDCYTVFGSSNKKLGELYDIVKVLSSNRITKEILNDEDLELVEPIEMTRAEIEEKLGHPFTIVED